MRERQRLRRRRKARIIGLASSAHRTTAIMQRHARAARLAALATAAWFACGAAALAADWPARPIRIIAPSTPGGAADLFARLLCEHFSASFHERCFVDNRAGAGGLIGTAATAQAAADGYTLTTSSTAYHVIAPLVAANPGFDPMQDFTHVAYIGGPPNVFVVNPALGVRSLADLVALGRTGQAIDYVSPGVGTLGHLLAESLAQKAGIRLQQIMTRGAAQGLMDLVAGTVKLGTMTWTSALGQVRAGKVIPIAVTSRARLREFPDLPTFAEQGYPELTAVSWFALSGPAGLPEDVVGRLNRAVADMLAQPDVRSRMERDAIETRVMSPAEFTQFVAGEIARWGPVAKRVIPK
jgi:tripartite-type tricarboxylate transporter receptor subunit TctC